MNAGYDIIQNNYSLPTEAAYQLRDKGFVVMQGPEPIDGWEALSQAYDSAVLAADPCDVSIRSSVRVSDFVNRGPQFDPFYIFPPLLAACRQVIGQPFKLSSMHARTLQPGAPAQPLHVDVKRSADGWPLLGFIVMVDEFHSENGATRFVPASHMLELEPNDLSKDHPEFSRCEVLACGPPGSVIIFNGSVWHGHSANLSHSPRRSLQGAFIPRTARATLDHSARIRRETFLRISDLAKYLLDLPSLDYK